MQKLWLVVLVAIIAGLIFVLTQSGESSNESPAIQWSQPVVSADQNISTGQRYGTDQRISADQLVGTWRESTTGEVRHFDSNGTTWIEKQRRTEPKKCASA